MAPIPLAEGEYVIWSSPRSKTKEISGRQAVVIAAVGLYVFISLAMLCVFAGWPGFIGGVATIVGIVAFVRWYRRRTAFFMTNKHLIDAGFIFKQRIPLSSIQGCERYVQEVHTRFGMERILTDKVLLLAGGQTITFGPAHDFDGLWELIHHGILASTIQISALPSLDGELAPAEKRTDVFLLASTTTDGDEYGPLFIGPSKVIRFTEKLPSMLERILFTVAAAQNAPEELEHHVQQLVRHPQAGHSLTFERDLTTASVNEGVLTLVTAERAIKMQLRPGDVTRATAFVRMWRPAHPMR